MTDQVEGAAVLEQDQTVAVGAKGKTKPAKTGNLILDIAASVEVLSKVQTLHRADKLVEDIDTNFFELGGVLSRINENSWFENFGDFAEFVYQKYGFKKRKADYLIQIYKDLVGKQIPWEKVSGLGWTKLKDLSPILTLENVDYWVDKAKNLTFLELKAVINASIPKEPGAKEPSQVIKVKLAFKEDQNAIYEAAISKGKAELGTDYPEVVVENVLAGYLGGTVVGASVAEAPAPLADQLKAMGWKDSLNLWCDTFPDVDIHVLNKAASEDEHQAA